MFSVHPHQQRACISRSAIPQHCACIECVYRFHLHQYLQNQFLHKQFIERCHTRPSPAQVNVTNTYNCHTRPVALQSNVTKCHQRLTPLQVNVTNPFNYERHLSHIRKRPLDNVAETCERQDKKPRVEHNNQAHDMSLTHRESKHAHYMSPKQQHLVVSRAPSMSPKQYLEDKHAPRMSPKQEHVDDKEVQYISPEQEHVEVFENITEVKVEPCDEVVEIKQEESIIDVEAVAPPNEIQEDKQIHSTMDLTAERDMAEIGGGIKIPRELDTLLRLNCSKNPAIFLRRLFYKGGVFTLEEIAACSITGKRTPHSPAETRPALDQDKFNVLKDYTIACCNLKPNTAEMVKFEARVRCLCTEARKILRKSTENNKKST